MSELAIRVENLGKRYHIGGRQERYKRFTETLMDTFSAPIRRLRSLGKPTPSEEIIWALKDVSFEVERGEVLGIIGRNGAGKTTLLKILSRITEPTEGRAEIHGRVGSLLEVGTGFHPELTGRENIYLNGAILGMHRAEIDAKFDEIVAFSEIEKFLDTPVKRYSSGMYVRLAFAVAAHLEPEILLVDEVLAVGDAEFQQKCLGKMGEVAQEGRTVLFVSHNMGAVCQLCERAVLLDAGRLTLDGVPSKVTAEYRTSAGTRRVLNSSFVGPLAQSLRFDHVTVNSADASQGIVISPSSGIIITAVGRAIGRIPSFRVTFALFRDGSRVLSLHDSDEPRTLPKGWFESQVEIPAFLLRPGEYSVALGGYQDGGTGWLWGTDLGYFHVNEEWSANYEADNIGVINLPCNGSRTLLPDVEPSRD